MSRKRDSFEDAFNLLCGDLIGRGIHRFVYECRIRPDLVVKVENNDHMRYFANVHEMAFWSEHHRFKAVADWLAPCEFLSPDGRILLQKRAEPLHMTAPLPDKLPAFLTDWKRENYGMYDGRFVCVDYAMTIPNPNRKLRKVTW